MPVRKRNGHWTVDVSFRGRRVRRTSPFNTKRDAQLYELVVRRKLINNTPIDHPSGIVPTLEEFYPRWFDVYVVTYNKPSEQLKKQCTFKNHLLPALGELKLNEISPRHLTLYSAEKVAAGYNPKSVNNHLSILRRCLTTAMEWEIITAVPRVRWLRTNKPKISFLEPDQCVQLLEAEKQLVWRAMVHLALRTGMRIGELRALRWSAVDLQRARVVVYQAFSGDTLSTPKSGKTRYLPLTPDTAEMLRAVRATQNQDVEYVFAHRSGRPFTTTETGEHIRRLYKHARLPPAGWHKFRHTFASHLVIAGVPIRTVQELMGHSTVVITERYAHLAPSALDGAVRTLVQATPFPIHNRRLNEGDRMH